MAYKKSNFQTFRITMDDGQEYSFQCFTQGTRYGFRHGCDVLDGYARPVLSVSCAYYNRTWERFRFESVLLKAIGKLPTEHQAPLRAWIHCIGDAEAAAVGAKVDAFRREYDKLPESMRAALRGCCPLETADDLQKAHAIAAMYNLITGD